MNRVVYEQKLDVSAESLWQILADFGGFLKWAGEGSIKVEGQGPGMIRRLDMAGAGKVAERADVIDHDSKTLCYTLVDGQPIGMASYSARVQLAPSGEDACSISWLGEFEPVEGMDATTVEIALEGAYKGMTAALAAYVARDTNPG